MNKKHVACAVVILIVVGMAQGTIWMSKRMAKMQADAKTASLKADTQLMQLQREQQQLADLRNGSKKLIDYLRLWQPYFNAVDSPQNAELKISLKIKEDNLVNLSQRYDVSTLKGNRSLPQLMRAQVTFEDDYAKLLNWLGQIETQLPTLRVSSIRVARGTGANDLKMDLIIEQPLLVK